MEAFITYCDTVYRIDFSKPIDISIPLVNSEANPIAWYLDKPEISPVVVGEWVGKVSEGQSSTNFNTIIFNPHGHGTHTECLGHITHEFYSVNESLKEYFFLAQLITVFPQKQENDDYIITLEQVMELWIPQSQKAIVIRTTPNDLSKRQRKYSYTNPPYLCADAATYLRERGVEHLLIDLPSVDREQDDGRLLAHKAFWNVKDTHVLNQDARLSATITELIYVPQEVEDGFYFLNIQLASFINDASPSKPVLYRII
ncbi:MULTISPECIES: cyclase family protein [Myroides]|uniref:Cyclase family protein n=1 Tax=Myroides albus TaxID=2562892 RepID=A0A6I3LHE1_9FLAO|nr:MULTISPECIES: cyclase family protein [Myroides]MTG98989.1 cyclase family protein [Myroides albus]MVX35777.1 cyclase family protein [Myroides sp. LoEW2-1]UVD78259.1 cyclase family protein [Myroides albus]